MKPRKIKEDFPIFQERENLVYLDNAATSQKPEKVIESIKEFYKENNSNVGRGLYDLANDSTQEYKKARKTVARFINSSTSEVVFVRNTTEAENLLAHSLEFEGDIVLSEMAHHSEQLPWRRKADQEGKKIKYLETRNGRISKESIREEIDKETGLVAVSHISNVFGAENPIEEIVEVAHENDGLVVLDAAQSAPHKPIDVENLDVDFMCFSGHKMLGPSSIGVLYGKKNLLEDLKPYQVGGGMIKSVEKENVSYEDVPQRFEAGTENVAGAVGLAKAIEYLQETGLEKVYQHDKELAEKMIEGLNKIDGIEVLSPDDASLVSFTADWAHPHDIAEVLNQSGVAVRAGNHCAQPQMEELGITGTTRACPYLYNTEEDVQKLVETVKESKKIFSQ